MGSAIAFDGTCVIWRIHDLFVPVVKIELRERCFFKIIVILFLSVSAVRCSSRSRRLIWYRDRMKVLEQIKSSTDCKMTFKQRLKRIGLKAIALIFRKS